MENTSPSPLFHKPVSIVAAKNILYTVMFLAVVIWAINRLNYGVVAGQAILELVVVLALLFALTKCVTLGMKWARVVAIRFLFKQESTLWFNRVKNP